MTEWTFADEIRLQPVNLARAALQFAQEIAYPELNVTAQVRRFAELAARAATAVPDESSPLRRGTLLAEFLFQGDDALLGDTETYDDPRNSFLNDVLDRRTGIPISLSVVFLEVARRLDIDAVGVGLPGHFIVAVRDGHTTWHLDPFHGGGRLSYNDCVRLTAVTTGYDGPFRPEWLEPAAPLDILGRMLNNLRASYVRLKHWGEAIRTISLLRRLYPDVPEHVRDLGLAYYRNSSTRLAAHYLEEYLRMQPDSVDAETIRSGMREAIERWVRQN